MAVKKEKRPGLRYLLSADARLQKLSLKKLSVRRAKTTSKRATRSSSRSTRAAESLQWPWTANPGALGLAGLGILAAATLFAAGQMSDRKESVADSMPLSEARFASAASSPTPARAEKPASSKPRTPERKELAAPKPMIVSTTKTTEPGPAPTAAAAAAPEPSSADSVTITGCLAQNKDGFWMKDASGADLSKSRSWRTGFFKKSSPRLDVTSSSVRLAAYVGQRVSATGILEDNALRARSVRRIATACD